MVKISRHKLHPTLVRLPHSLVCDRSRSSAAAALKWDLHASTSLRTEQQQQADLTAESAKGVSRGSEDPGVAALAKARNALSFGVHEAAAQGSCANETELCDVLVDLDISPGNPAHKAAMDAAREWATSRGRQGCSRGYATG